MKILKRVFYVLLFVFLSSGSIYCQENTDLFKSSMKECGMEWIQEKYKDVTYEHVLNVFNANHKEVIRFKYIKDASLIEDSISIDAYIRNAYYVDKEVLHNATAKSEETELLFYMYAVENGENPPKNDKHVIVKICNENYLVSYFSMYGVDVNRVTFDKFQCLNLILETKCM